MSQEMNILCCYLCQMFQVHIVKKAKKWKCKVCNEKQSIRRVYFQGSGKDCRFHVQQLNSQKQKGFESVQTTHSNIDDTSYISYDSKESSSNQQISDNLSNESEVIFDDIMQVSDEEYTCEEQTVDSNYERPSSHFNHDLTYESEIFDRTNNEVKELKSVNSHSDFHISNNIEIKAISNDTKESQNIFESYEDFDVALDF
ncbi:hypothetical protein KPH14_011135 [Odynerus spinipes]|uniref:MRN complex-interacting protein N-terminal domain-containing protein n=1 Tax=Odynerus spinipes TaxID=1348599 RepID=A0AAD9VLJ7_9HYME|nr:hypothetical protein KPH14_011135 [Odynerus spinipes]